MDNSGSSQWVHVNQLKYRNNSCSHPSSIYCSVNCNNKYNQREERPTESSIAAIGTSVSDEEVHSSQPTSNYHRSSLSSRYSHRTHLAESGGNSVGHCPKPCRIILPAKPRPGPWDELEKSDFFNCFGNLLTAVVLILFGLSMIQYFMNPEQPHRHAVKTQVNVSKDVKTPVNVTKVEQPPVSVTTEEKPPISVITEEKPPISVITEEKPPISVTPVDKPPVIKNEEVVTEKPKEKTKVIEENKTSIKRSPENDSQEGMTTVKIIEETIIQDDEVEDIDEEEEEEEEEEEVMDTTQSTEQAVEEVEIAGYELETEDIDKDMEEIQAVEELAGDDLTEVKEASSNEELNQPTDSNEVVSETPSPAAIGKKKEEERPVKRETVVEEKTKQKPEGELPEEQQRRAQPPEQQQRVPPPEQPGENVHHHQHYISRNRNDPNTRIQEIHRHKKKIKSEAKAMKSKKRRKQIEKTSWTNCLYGFGTDFIPSVSWFRLLLFGEVMTEAMEDGF